MKNEFKGTEGKWSIDNLCSDLIISNHFNNGGDIICQAPDKDMRRSLDFWKANAQLISKAPEMLEMLKELLSDITQDEYLHDTSIKQFFEHRATEVEQLIKEATTI